jgi:putative endonuclease
MSGDYCVSMMTDLRNTVLYTGVTNNLKRRVLEHRTVKGGGFSKRYNVITLIYFEVGDDVSKPLFREKQIKGWNRKRKEELISILNPEWKDLYDEI